MKIKHHTAMTIFELIITLAIVSILASIAYPTYESMLRNSRRKVAQSQLMALGHQLTRYRILNNTYLDFDVESTVAKVDKENPHYHFVFEEITPNTFQLAAVGQNAQGEDNCGHLHIDHHGKTWSDKHCDSF